MKCDREPNEANIKKLGVCPASIDKSLNSINCGTNAGRFCWRYVRPFKKLYGYKKICSIIQFDRHLKIFITAKQVVLCFILEGPASPAAKFGRNILTVSARSRVNQRQHPLPHEHLGPGSFRHLDRSHRRLPVDLRHCAADRRSLRILPSVVCSVSSAKHCQVDTDSGRPPLSLPY